EGAPRQAFAVKSDTSKSHAQRPPTRAHRMRCETPPLALVGCGPNSRRPLPRARVRSAHHRSRRALHTREIVVAYQNRHLIRRMGGEPREQLEAVLRCRVPLFTRPPIEMIAHRNERDIAGEATVVAERAMAIEHVQECGERSLRIADGEPMRAPISIRHGL